MINLLVLCDASAFDDGYSGGHSGDIEILVWGFCRLLQNFFFSVAFAAYTGTWAIIGREYRHCVNHSRL